VRSIRIGWPKTPGRENFTRARREDAGTLQDEKKAARETR
jgi:hypothetical protein